MIARWILIAAAFVAVVGVLNLDRASEAQTIFEGLGPQFGGQPDGDVFLSGSFSVQQGTRKGVLSIRAEVTPGWHIYSISQAAGGPQASKLTVADSPKFRLLGPFQPDRNPVVHPPAEFPVPSEEHEGTVTWNAPIEIEDGVDPQQLIIPASYTGQVCAAACINIEPRPIEAKFSGYTEAPAASGEYRPDPGSASLTLSGKVEPAAVAAGGKVKVLVTATPDAGWHLYAADLPASANAKPTLILLTRLPGWQQSPATTPSKPIEKKGGPAYYDKPVTWTIELTPPANLQPGEYVLSGYFGAQTCTEKNCLPGAAARFQATINVGRSSQDAAAPLTFTEAKYAEVAKMAAEDAATVTAMSTAKELNWSTLFPILGLAMLGGLILNAMPCVLPVLGLKLLSFAKQGGESRSKVMLLNLAYTAGLLSVFLVLAGFVAFANLGWGEQFTNLWFRVGLTGLVFVMALSFLGVWELPIPGFATSDAAGDLQHREGYQGAFFKGLFTTIIATPCSGPFLGSVLGLTADQPPLAIFLIFTAVGLGMAAPYLLVGLFPALARVIPKPGAWMETFERILGFVMLMAAVAQFSTIGADYYVAGLAALVGLAFACWLIGRVPEYAERRKVWSTWVIGGCIAAAIGFLSFTYLGPHLELPWQPFSRVALEQKQREGKTVMVDFTADWCLTCKVNSRTAINTERVLALVEKNDVAPLLADWTNPSPEIKAMLAEHKSKSIPLLVIYPAGKPGEAIVLRDSVIESQVVKALEAAGPSKPPATAVTADYQSAANR